MRAQIVISVVILTWIACCAFWVLRRKSVGFHWFAGLVSGFLLGGLGLGVFIGFNFLFIEWNLLPREYYFSEYENIVVAITLATAAILMLGFSLGVWWLLRNRKRKKMDWKAEVAEIGKRE